MQLPIVIDNGSSKLRIGMCDGNKPTSVFPSIVGYLKDEFSFCDECYIGNEAQLKREILKVSYPVHGVVTNWYEMEKIWHHAYYNELRVAPEEHPVLLSEPALNKLNREKITTMMFENFNVPALYIQNQGALSLYSIGLTTGIVYASGSGTTQVIPVEDGHTISQSVISVDFSGNDIDEYMARLLFIESGNYFTIESTKHLSTIRNIKEKLCYVAFDFEAELKSSTETSPLNHTHELPDTFQLPDGKKITINSERFRCTEVLFKPFVWNNFGKGIHEEVFTSIMKCDKDLRKNLYMNIVLSGGSTMFKGFEKRLKKELELLAPKTTKIEIIAPEERELSVWIGGTILASIATFQQMWITKAEYEENGPQISHQQYFI